MADTTSTTASRIPGSRLVFLDALRGLAALSVAWYHFYAKSTLHVPLARVLPGWIDTGLHHAYLGVDVFFVLSGFVIALSIDGTKITAGFVGRFALRRSIRLDPPYWVTLAIASVLLALAHRPITAGQVAAHVVYLQGILGYPQIVSMFWTLCYEIQFYLVLVLMVGLWQRSGRWTGFLLATIPFASSVVLVANGIHTGGVFIDWWYAFALGVATYAMLTRRLSIGVWLLALTAVAFATHDQIVDPAATVAAAAFIGVVGLSGKLANWSGGPVLQFLGRISYSLYLIHFVGNTVSKYVAARHPSAVIAAGAIAAATAVSIAAAYTLHRLVEVPTHQWSRRVAMQPGNGPVITPAVATVGRNLAA